LIANRESKILPVLIRPYVPSDSSALAQCHNAAFSEEQMTSEAFAQLLEEISVNQGQGWVIEESGLPLGYALATPVPGLDRILDLRGCIDPARHRQGYGRCSKNSDEVVGARFLMRSTRWTIRRPGF
jgi:hypothetical protein